MRPPGGYWSRPGQPWNESTRVLRPPRSSGYVHDTEKEFAEGCVTMALVTGKLGVGSAAYLKGVGEVVGELRRYILDAIRRGDLAPVEALLVDMDDIYGVLVTMDFPDAFTGGLRRPTDSARGILEDARRRYAGLRAEESGEAAGNHEKKAAR